MFHQGAAQPQGHLLAGVRPISILHDFTVCLLSPSVLHLLLQCSRFLAFRETNAPSTASDSRDYSARVGYVSPASSASPAGASDLVLAWLNGACQSLATVCRKAHINVPNLLEFGRSQEANTTRTFVSPSALGTGLETPRASPPSREFQARWLFFLRLSVRLFQALGAHETVCA